MTTADSRRTPDAALLLAWEGIACLSDQLATVATKATQQLSMDEQRHVLAQLISATQVMSVLAEQLGLPLLTATTRSLWQRLLEALGRAATKADIDQIWAEALAHFAAHHETMQAQYERKGMGDVLHS